MTHVPFLVAAWLFTIGLFGLATSRHLIRTVMCLAVMQSSTYVLILLAGYRSRAGAPIFTDVLPGSRSVDPVVHALTLTDIVVGATVSALLLAMALRIHRTCGTLDPDASPPMAG